MVFSSKGDNMTCIVGLKHKDKVYIGGDSLGANTAFQKTVRADEKVFQKDDMIFGFTSSFRMGQILRYSFFPPARIENITDMQYLRNIYSCINKNIFRSWIFI